MTAYFARNGSVFVSDGPWEAKLTESQCDGLLSIWDAADAVSLFNQLYDAMTAAGLNPCTYARRPTLRLVSDRAAAGIVREMLAACPEVQGPGSAA